MGDLLLDGAGPIDRQTVVVDREVVIERHLRPKHWLQALLEGIAAILGVFIVFGCVMWVIIFAVDAVAWTRDAVFGSVSSAQIEVQTDRD